MMNFEFHNPVRIIFGPGEISQLPRLIDPSEKVMLLYGGGSIKKNTVYEQIAAGLKDHKFDEFGGIEPNPQYQTCMKAVDEIKRKGSTYLLAAGGGSVIDAAKFIAAAALFEDGDPWDILEKQKPIKDALPFGTVLTLPATGSEMNMGSVISRAETKQKLVFLNPLVFPKFSILDPQVTRTLPTRQTINGIVDAYVHVVEQYLTYPVDAPLQDRFCESVMLTLIEEGPRVLNDPADLDARANIMWAAPAL